jgi:hypothetical protein
VMTVMIATTGRRYDGQMSRRSCESTGNKYDGGEHGVLIPAEFCAPDHDVMELALGIERKQVNT